MVGGGGHGSRGESVRAGRKAFYIKGGVRRRGKG